MREKSLLPILCRHALVLVALCICVLTPRPLAAQSPQPEAKPANSTTTALRIELTGGEARKPVIDASVYLKFTEVKALRDKQIELNLKTNQSGVARSPGIPKGRILIQIVAPGWKTFGQYYELSQDEQTIQINLDRPSTRWLQQK
jgi:hypothetical protein